MAAGKLTSRFGDGNSSDCGSWDRGPFGGGNFRFLSWSPFLLLPSTPHIECVFVKICHMNQTLIVGVVYRPPNNNIADFNDSMHFVLEKIACQPCYIMGDFNLDLLKHELHPPSEKFLDTMYANSLIPVINRPTRVTKDTCTLIDNIFTNDYDTIDNHFYGIL